MGEVTSSSNTLLPLTDVLPSFSQGLRSRTILQYHIDIIMDQVELEWSPTCWRNRLGLQIQQELPTSHGLGFNALSRAASPSGGPSAVDLVYPPSLTKILPGRPGSDNGHSGARIDYPSRGQFKRPRESAERRKIQGRPAN